jgi:hypothetical protein
VGECLGLACHVGIIAQAQPPTRYISTCLREAPASLRISL